MLTGIIASYVPGREPVARFAPGQPVVLVDVNTPVGWWPVGEASGDQWMRQGLWNP